MFATLLRVLFGFLIACLIAGFVQAGFVMTPVELYSLPENVMYDRLGDAGILALVAATQCAVFAAPFALIAAAVGEWQGIRSIFFYTFIGLAIALGGFTALYASEVNGQASIVNGYAITTFAVTGIVGGLVYWLLSGRLAGEPEDEELDLAPPIASPPPSRLTRPAAAVPPARPGPVGTVPAVRPGPTPAAPPPSPSAVAVPPRKA
jgi:hypothetical protein